MKVKFTFTVQIIEDDSRETAKESYGDIWYANYDPTENYSGLQKELAEFVKEGLAELEQIPKA